MGALMIDPVVLVALAMLAGAPLALAPLPTAAAALAVAALIRRRTSRGALAIAALALVIAGARARARIDGAAALHQRVVEVLRPPPRCEGEGTVVSSPVVLGRASGPAKGEGQARVDVAIERGVCGERAIGEPLRARLYGAPEDLARGDRVEIVADLAAVQLFANEGLADPRPPIARSGVAASGGIVEVRVIARSRSIGAIVDRARSRVRARIEATFHADASALGRALVLGESDLDPADDEAFRASGLSHLLAVSGTHLVIAVAGIAAALGAILARVGPIAARTEPRRIAAAVAIPIAWIYADFAGGSGSAIRAAAMLSAALLARALGRRAPAERSLACSMIVLAALDPLVASDVSFALSAGATAGLVAFQRPIAAAIVRGPAPLQKPLAAIATTLAAMAGCTPILAVLAPTIPILGVASNLVAAPLGELAALPICLLHAVLWWAPPIERGAALLGSGALLGVRAVARWSSAAGATLPLAPPTAAQLGVLAVAIAAAWTAPSRARRAAALIAGAAAWLLCELAATRAGAPRGALRVTVLDVAQGDAVLVDLPDGGALLVDGGGMVGSPVDLGARVILPVLRARRRTRVDVAVLSHPHPDHFGGLASALPALDVGELWDTGQGEDQGAGPGYASLIAGARERGIPIRRPADLCGRPRAVGGALIEVLAPCPGYAPDAGANDNSLVVRVTFGARAALLVGDAEHAEEDALLARDPAAVRADFLKVGHHGSRTSTSPRFLAAVAPTYAAISSGVRNRFGHPAPATLATLALGNVEIARTDRGGQITWETDGAESRLTRPAHID